MASIALFHSVLGVRPGIDAAAERLRADGHVVRVVDQYHGRVFDDYDEALAFAESIGYPALMSLAVDAVSDLPDGFVTIGYSIGGGMAEFVATQRPVSGVVMLSGAIPLAAMGAGPWPAGMPGQIHYAVGDLFRSQDEIDGVVAEAHDAGAEVGVFDYPGNGHLFTDASLPAEYDAVQTEVLWERVLAFDPLRRKM
jgi:dienelactone hydrolase